MNKRVLITGGAGFIGSHLAKRLLIDGDDVTIFDWADPGTVDPMVHELEGQGVVWFQGDVRDMWRSYSLSTDWDEIYLLAGLSTIGEAQRQSFKDFSITVKALVDTIEFLTFLPKHPLITFVSSGAVYGDAQECIHEETITAPISIYGATRLAAEMMLETLGKAHGFETCSIRLFSTYGPGQRKQVIYDLIHRLHCDPNHLVVRSPADVVRDFIYIDDAVEGIIAATREGKHNRYNLANGYSYNLREVVDRLSDIMQIDPHVDFLSGMEAFHPHRWYVDISSLKANSSWRPKYTLTDGLKKTVEWYKETHS